MADADRVVAHYPYVTVIRGDRLSRPRRGLRNDGRTLCRLDTFLTASAVRPCPPGPGRTPGPGAARASWTAEKSTPTTRSPRIGELAGGRVCRATAQIRHRGARGQQPGEFGHPLGVPGDVPGGAVAWLAVVTRGRPARPRRSHRGPGHAGPTGRRIIVVHAWHPAAATLGD